MSKAAQVKDRLRNLSRETGKSFDYLLTHYFIERLLFRISISRYSERFILKGGLLLYTRFDMLARVTRDVDFLALQINNTTDELTRIFSEISAIQSDDAIEFRQDSIVVERIMENAEYQGVRVKLTGYLEKTRQVLQLDIGFGDIVIPHPVLMEYPSLLDMERAKIMAYSLESVVAEKFEAMIVLAEANSRMKDFYDVQLFAQTCVFEGRILSEAIAKTMERRNTPRPAVPMIFMESFSTLPDKQVQWNAFLRRSGIAIDVGFRDAVRSIAEFLYPIYKSIIRNHTFQGIWREGRWE